MLGNAYQNQNFYSVAGYSGVRTLDVSATLDEAKKQMVLYVVNRSRDKALEANIITQKGNFKGKACVMTVNGKDVKTENTFEKPEEVVTRETTIKVDGKAFEYSFEPHSFTALICPIE